MKYDKSAIHIHGYGRVASIDKYPHRLTCKIEIKGRKPRKVPIRRLVGSGGNQNTQYRVILHIKSCYACQADHLLEAIIWENEKRKIKSRSSFSQRKWNLSMLGQMPNSSPILLKEYVIRTGDLVGLIRYTGFSNGHQLLANDFDRGARRAWEVSVLCGDAKFPVLTQVSPARDARLLAFENLKKAYDSGVRKFPNDYMLLAGIEEMMVE